MKQLFWFSIQTIRRGILSLLLTPFVFSPAHADDAFVSTSGTQFYREGHTYYYIGTNFWYGPILASTGQGGNRARLAAELDSLKALGIDNLRVLAGADAGSVNANTVQPYLQPVPGQLNDTLLIGLDYFLAELEKRHMVAVIYLNNSWDWSGGYGFYLKHAGAGDSPYSGGNGYDSYVKYASQFVRNSRAKELFFDYVRQILTRTNTITGRPYRDEPSIMAWQVGNEPRSFSDEGKADFEAFVKTTARLIKSLDSRHLVSVGSEGAMGCEGDISLFERLHMEPAIDYLTIHIWPQNWGWCDPTRLTLDMPYVYQKTTAYLDEHQRLAVKLDKPLVVEEFGYPRDHMDYSPLSATTARDAFYRFLFGKVVESFRHDRPLAGCNFWGWGGAGRPTDETWHLGCDYLCDPPHEPQGWYSVFDSDSTTTDLIKVAVKSLSE
jgi:mannan endo-1,4-beta-mannosidase